LSGRLQGISPFKLWKEGSVDNGMENCRFSRPRQYETAKSSRLKDTRVKEVLIDTIWNKQIIKSATLQLEKSKECGFIRLARRRKVFYCSTGQTRKGKVFI